MTESRICTPQSSTCTPHTCLECTHTTTHTTTFTHPHIHNHIHTSTPTRIHTQPHPHTYAPTYTPTHIHTHIHTRIHAHTRFTHTHPHTYTPTCAPSAQWELQMMGSPDTAEPLFDFFDFFFNFLASVDLLASCRFATCCT